MNQKQQIRLFEELLRLRRDIKGNREIVSVTIDNHKDMIVVKLALPKFVLEAGQYITYSPHPEMEGMIQMYTRSNGVEFICDCSMEEYEAAQKETGGQFDT